MHTCFTNGGYRSHDMDSNGVGEKSVNWEAIEDEETCNNSNNVKYTSCKNCKDD